MENVKEKHVKCPYEKECTDTTYCHFGKYEVTDMVDGELILTQVIHDCDRPVIKV